MAAWEEDDELVFDIEANDDDTKITLVVSSPSGKKITQAEFIVMLEAYLHEVTGAEILRRESGALNH